ncbi:MAG: hypothetical protein ACREL5_08060 [Gemmatimonadales bacterium]
MRPRGSWPSVGLADSTMVYTFRRAQQVHVSYWLQRGLVRAGDATLQLTQVAAGATVFGAFMPWHQSPRQARVCAGGSCADSSDCEVALQTGSCGAVGWSVLPFWTPSVWGTNEFQSQSGTGASTPITVTFSGPVQVARVLIEDPTYAGNVAVAYDSAGATIGSAAFAYSGTPGVNHPDSATLVGAIRSLVLTPAPADYVAYHLEIVLPPRIVIAFAVGTPMASGRPLVRPPWYFDPLIRKGYQGDREPKPSYGGTDWPDTLLFTIRIDSAGTTLHDRYVRLTLDAADDSGAGADASFGHFHHSSTVPKPTGALSVGDSVSTGASGTVTIVYRASILA